MITTAELHHAARREGLRFDQVEKDYVILCVLSGLSRARVERAGWTFKGGTCLRHCYYPGYRFSEDIDFTCRPADENLARSVRLLEAAAEHVREATGVGIEVREGAESPEQAQLEIPLRYTRGGARRQNLPAVRVHLTFDEPVLTAPERRQILPSYPDLSAFTVSAYSLAEIVSEKLRGLLQQQEKWPRPRDLYDLWYVLCQRREPLDPGHLVRLFNQKCGVRGIPPSTSGLVSETLREWNREAWQAQIVPMMKDAPNYDDVWEDWGRAHAALVR